MEDESLDIVACGGQAEDAASFLVGGLDVLESPGCPQPLHAAILYEFSSEGGGLLGRRIACLAAMFGLLLLGADGAGAATVTFPDAQGGAVGGAADRARVGGSHGFAGNVTLA